VQSATFTYDVPRLKYQREDEVLFCMINCRNLTVFFPFMLVQFTTAFVTGRLLANAVT